MSGAAADPRELDALAAGTARHPFHVLGPPRTVEAGRPAAGGARRSSRGASSVELVAKAGRSPDGQRARPAFRGHAAVERPAARAGLPAARPRGPAVHDLVDPYQFGPVLTDFDLHLFAEGTHYRAWEQLGARRPTIGHVDRRALRRVGAQRAARQRRRRLQPLGRARAPDAPPDAVRHLGALHPRSRRRRPLQVRGAHAAAAICCRRPTRSRAARGAAAARRRSSGRDGYIWGDAAWMRAPRRRRLARAADVDLRSAPRLVAPRARRRPA